MFNHSVKPDSKQDEGTVMQVDLKRGVCKVVTLQGQKLDSVQWLRLYGGNDRYGDRSAPRMGDRVMLNHGLGYPVIQGFLPRIQSGGQSFPLNIDTGSSWVDTGNYSGGMTAVTADASTPPDMLLGDRVISSQGGAIVALLRAGSVLLRSSRAAEIFMSRLGDVVRVTSRNYEHFTDASSDMYRNYKGRVYRYFGIGNSFTKSKNEDYNYHQYYGDTVAAEAIKTDYVNVTSEPAAAGDVIFKEQVTKSDGTEVMRRTLNLEGVEEVVVTGSGSFTRIKTTNGVVTLSFGDEHTATIDSGQIKLHHSGGADVTLSANGVSTTFSGHFCNVTAGGVQLG